MNRAGGKYIISWKKMKGWQALVWILFSFLNYLLSSFLFISDLLFFPLLFLLLQLGFFALKATETSSGLYRMNKSFLAARGIAHRVRGRPEAAGSEAFHLQARGTTGDLPGTPPWVHSYHLPSSSYLVQVSNSREKGEHLTGLAQVMCLLLR